MKKCTKCLTMKELDDFHRDKTKKDGRRNWCKSCAISATMRWKDTPSGRASAQAAALKYSRSDKGVAYAAQRRLNGSFSVTRKKYRQSERGKATEKRYRESERGKEVQRVSHAKYAAANREKRVAKNAVNNAVMRGKMLPVSTLQCTHCDEQAENYHHPDYNFPLVVIPLCRMCHTAIHR